MSDDEDRKFFRAAAEAIVASSMNSNIDPTIIELLRRIQYASLTKNDNNNNNDNNYNNNTGTHLHDRVSTVDGNGQPSNEQTRDSTTATELNGLIDSTKADHFPTFNLDYFNGQQREQELEKQIQEQKRKQAQQAQQAQQQQQQKQLQQTQQSHSPQSSRPFAFPSSATSPAPSQPSQLQLQQQPQFSLQLAHTPNSIRGTSSPSSPSNGEEKPFQCADCTLSFRRSSDLRRHQRAHLPVLPHICQQCGKGFARKDALKRHTDTLTCKRNRERLLSSGGDLDLIIHRGRDL